MNVLFLCHRLPLPLNKGEKIRAFNILSHLARTHTVHLACFVETAEEARLAPNLKDLVGGETFFVRLNRPLAALRMGEGLGFGRPLTTSYFSSSNMRRWLRRLAVRKKIDRAIAFSTVMTPFLMKESLIEPAHVLFDMVDVDSEKWREYGAARRDPKSWLYRRESQLLFKLERDAANAFGATTLASPFEAKAFVDLAPETNGKVFSLPNGVDLDYFAPEREHADPFPANEMPIVMTGTMSYRPNEEGAQWFIRQVLPLVRSRLPQARFYVVGAGGSSKLKSLAGEAVAVTGRVDDVRPYLAHARAVVAPLQMARGVQNKVLEGMAMQKPVVATSCTARALDVESAKELLIADDPNLFGQAVIEAIGGESATQMAARARLYVERNHDWRRNLRALDTWLALPSRACGQHDNTADANASSSLALA